MAPETLEQKVERLEAANAALTQEKAAQATELAVAEATIGEMGEKLANVEAGEVKHEVVSFEKVQYRVLAQKFNFEGTEVKATELQKNKEVLAALVKAGSGLLQKVEATK